MVTKKQRARQLARQKWERQQSRRAQRRSRARRRAIIAGAVVGVLIVGAGGYGLTLLVKEDRPASAAPTPTTTPPPVSASPSPSPTEAPRPTKPGECSYVAQEGTGQQAVGLPAEKAPVKDAVATITTNLGTIEADLFGEAAACAVNSFRHLATKNAFDDTTCTGLAVAPAPARFLECGDVTGSGAGGPGYIFGNENDDKRSIEPGWLVMTGGENRNGSRFGITYGDTSRFEQPVTVFGKVSTGLDLVSKAARGGLAPNSGTQGVGRPATSVIILDVKVTTT
ncbi:peptidylprolyl isomerase [Actinopolymorpha sp. B17G11]|uniref:peptidylprolyl isomerase n=1 Tax=unclassified Actinopolymorpha TaxID=2627063 RepID=UPI0032D8B73E